METIKKRKKIENNKKEEKKEKIKSDNYVDSAERVIRNLRRGRLSTTKIRSVLSLCTVIYHDVLRSRSADDKLSEEQKQQIQRLRVRLAYDAGRDSKVDKFVKEANLMYELKEIKDSKQNFLLFYHYVEALVAFHRYEGGE